MSLASSLAKGERKGFGTFVTFVSFTSQALLAMPRGGECNVLLSSPSTMAVSIQVNKEAFLYYTIEISKDSSPPPTAVFVSCNNQQPKREKRQALGAG